MEKIKYKIKYELGIEEKLLTIPRNMRERIRKAIETRLTMAPNDMGKVLTKEWKEHRRLRVGKYRIIYKVFDDTILVLIVEVDHRKDVYKD